MNSSSNYHPYSLVGVDSLFIIGFSRYNHRIRRICNPPNPFGVYIEDNRIGGYMENSSSQGINGRKLSSSEDKVLRSTQRTNLNTELTDASGFGCINAAIIVTTTVLVTTSRLSNNCQPKNNKNHNPKNPNEYPVARHVLRRDGNGHRLRLLEDRQRGQRSTSHGNYEVNTFYALIINELLID